MNPDWDRIARETDLLDVRRTIAPPLPKPEPVKSTPAPRYVTQKELHDTLGEIADVIGDVVKKQAARIEALEAKLAEVEERGIRYRGVFQKADEYRRGDVTTFDGSAWVCIESTTDEPGTSKAWTLAVKRGRDGKDAKLREPVIR